MSEIPDWLMQQLAPDEEEPDDLGIAPPLEEAPEPAPLDDVYGLMGLTEPDDSPNPVAEMADPMAALRTEIDSTEEAASSASLFESMTTPAARTTTSNLSLGILPWQRLFLSVLLFLDVGIIGLLFLVMLGSISIPTF